MTRILEPAPRASRRGAGHALARGGAGFKHSARRRRGQSALVGQPTERRGLALDHEPGSDIWDVLLITDAGLIEFTVTTTTIMSRRRFARAVSRAMGAPVEPMSDRDHVLTIRGALQYMHARRGEPS